MNPSTYKRLVDDEIPSFNQQEDQKIDDSIDYQAILLEWKRWREHPTTKKFLQQLHDRMVELEAKRNHFADKFEENRQSLISVTIQHKTIKSILDTTQNGEYNYA